MEATVTELDAALARVDEDDRVCACECGPCMFPGVAQHCDKCNADHKEWKRRVGLEQTEVSPSTPKT